MAFKTVTATVQSEQVGRVDLLVRDVTELPRSQVKGLIDHGCVTINELLCSSIGHPIAEGDQVVIHFDPHRRYKAKKRSWDDRTFEIVFEDDHLIVVNKAAGTLTVPTENDDANTLVDRVSIYLNHSRRNKAAWVVHRLDRDISGLLVFAKQEPVAKALIEQFKRRKPARIYAAIVAGQVDATQDFFDDENKAAGNNTRDRGNTAAGGEATAEIRVVEQFRDTALVEIELNSGRRSAVRDLLAESGHVVLGDHRYGIDESTHRRWVRKRIAMHAKTLSILHPATGQPITFDSPLPAAIVKFISGSKREGTPSTTGTPPTSPWDQAKRKQKTSANQGQ